MGTVPVFKILNEMNEYLHSQVYFVVIPYLKNGSHLKRLWGKSRGS